MDVHALTCPDPALAGLPPGLARLRQWASRPAPVEERCELCSLGLHAEHAHLLELSSRRLLCACDPCAILFSGRENARYVRVPRRSRYLPDFRLSDVQWAGLQIPIGLAFMVYNTPAGRITALYPSPGGAIESLLPLNAWDELVADNPVLAKMEPDVEALLVCRVRDPREHFLVPIDACYRLVGLVRVHWRGLSGGKAVWEYLDRFFEELKARSIHGGAVHA